MAKTIAEPLHSFPDLLDFQKLKAEVPKRTYAQPEKLKPFIIEVEGGLSGAQSDRASKNYCPTPLNGKYYHTNKGVTYATWVVFFGKRKDKQFLEMPDKYWMKIFFYGYWDRWKASDIYAQNIANILVDWVYISGVWGVKFPQRLLGVDDDGIVGTKTLTTLNKQNKDKFSKRLFRRREKQFRDIAKSDTSQNIFLNGWLNRLKRLEKFNGKF